jgi:hypothetical protein
MSRPESCRAIFLSTYKFSFAEIKMVLLIVGQSKHILFEFGEVFINLFLL